MNETIDVVELNSANLPNLDYILRIALDHYKDYFSIKPPINLTDELLDKRRKQYNAQKIIYAVYELKKRNGWQKCIAITDKDIFIDSMNFVFGLASPSGGICLVSLHRLVEGNKHNPTENEKDRIAKEITHEIGHIYGLQHCTGNCVMAFSNSVLDVDAKNPELCEKCKRILNL